MKNHNDIRMGLAVFAIIGSLLPSAPVEAQSTTDLTNMARLIGSWQFTPDQEGMNHLLFTCKGSDVIVTIVTDKDYVFPNGTSLLKGERHYWGKFRLNGRRLSGDTSVGPQSVALNGIVSEDFRRIDWSFLLPAGINSNTGSHDYMRQTLVKQ